ncbi:hypothetical protein GQ600_3423 [Phytophthora cactorum]|nr:hypothetical protein GQ600_3423 [Phytophthora cactorum]
MLTSAVLNAGYNVSVAVTAGANINDTPTLMIMSVPFVVRAYRVSSTAEGNMTLRLEFVMFTTNFIFLTFAVCWTSPLETSVGVMLTIPLAGLTDTFVRHASFTWISLVV